MALVELANKNEVSKIDKTMPVVQYKIGSSKNKYCVVRLEDILCSVGLVKAKGKNWFSVISHHIFKEPLDKNAGSMSNI